MNDGNNNYTEEVVGDGLLLVGLDGFTLEDIADLWPGLGIALHVKDGDDWVPIKLDQIITGIKL